MRKREFQPAFSSGILSPALTARVDFQKYDSALKDALNMVVKPEGGAAKAPGTRFIADTGNPGKVRLIPFTFNADQSYALEFSEKRIRVMTPEGLLLKDDGADVAVESPYLEKDLFDISYVQSADVVYLAHRDYPPQKLMRYDYDDWRMEEMTFLPKTVAPEVVNGRFSVAGSARIWRYAVTAIDVDTGEESLPSPILEVPGTETMRVGVLVNGNPVQDYFTTLDWTAVDNANEYRIYKETSDGGGLFGYIGSSVNNTFEDRNIAPNTENTPPVDYNPFSNGNYPGVAAMHQQRLAFFNSWSRPSTGWLSRTGNYENFTKSVKTREDDFIELTLASREVNPVQWAVSLRGLVVGTMGDVQHITGGNVGKALSPTSMTADPQSFRGSAAGLVPVVIDNVILHVNRSRTKVFDLQYSSVAESYAGDDRSLFASHLFQNRRIVDCCYQEAPYSIVWYVMDDGMLLGLTWLAPQQVAGWHKHATLGEYESVCCMPGPDMDRVFAVVRRTVGGRDVRYVEMMEAPLVSPDYLDKMPAARQAAILARAFYVHSGLTYEGDPVDRLYGLDHLEGEEVAILADGAVHPRQVVKNGSIRLGSAASVVQVGLPYEAYMETVNFEPEQQTGVSIGKAKRVAQVAVRFQDTTSAEVGINSQTVAGKWRSDEPYDSPTRLRSGIKTFTVPGRWSRDTSVIVSSTEPTPLTVLSVIPEVSIDE